MRIIKILLWLSAVCAAFLVSYTGTRISLHRDLMPRYQEYARLPAALIASMHWPHALWPHLVRPDTPQPARPARHYAKVRKDESDAFVAALDEPDESDAKLAKEPIAGVDTVAKPKCKPVHVDVPVARRILQPTGMVESASKPLMPPPQMLRMATVRVNDLMLADVSAKHGAIIRFKNGSYLSIAPNFLTHDTAITVALSSPALPETTAFDAVSDAMVVTFKPIVDGLAYADPVPPNMPGAAAGLAVSNRDRVRLSGHMVTFVKRVFLADGTSTDFEEHPTNISQIMTADLAEDHVLKFTARYAGTILVSLQRLKTAAVVGYRGGPVGY